MTIEDLKEATKVQDRIEKLSKAQSQLENKLDKFQLGPTPRYKTCINFEWDGSITDLEFDEIFRRDIVHFMNDLRSTITQEIADLSDNFRRL